MFSDGVYYRAVGDAGYVLNQNTGKSYFFEDTAAAILAALAEGVDDPAAIAGRLALEYDIPDAEAVIEDVTAFLSALRGENILSAPPAAPGPLPEDYVFAYAREHLTLQSVMLELTYRCNERCLHCYTCDAEKDADKELTTDEYRRLLDRLSDCGVSEVVLSGGEIGLRRDFAEIYAYAVKKGFLVTLMTNGTLFSPEDMELLYRCPPKIVYISFYGASPATHDRVTGVPGSFRKSLDTLMRLKCAGILVGMKTVAMTLTLDDFENIVALARQLRVGLGTGMYLTCGNNGDKTPAQYRLTRDVDYRRVVEAKQAYARSATPYRVRDVDGPICEAGTMGFSINPYGDIYVCTSLPVSCGNIREVSIADFWTSDPYLQRIRALRFSDTGCADCADRNECVYCVGANFVETGELFAVQRGHCQAAKAFHDHYREAGLCPASDA